MNHIEKSCIITWIPLTNLRRKLATALLATTAFIGAASAADLAVRPAPTPACYDFVLSCDNGRVYPFCPRAVSLAGDVVTGTLITGPYRAIHMRLIPMGVGYRFAGRGVWFDGFHSSAILNFGKYSSVACTVTTSGPWARRFSGLD